MDRQMQPLRIAAQRIQGKLERLAYGDRYMEKIFTKYYVSNFWKDSESASGPGSNLEQTAEIRKRLPLLLRQLGVASMLDIPCGDFLWMKDVPFELSSYIGADIVETLIDINNTLYGNPCRSFVKLDAVKDRIPPVDLIFNRDCLVHFSANDIVASLRNFRRSGSTYLLTTTFTGRRHNAPIETGGWRPVNLQAPPFNLPYPMKIINERCTQSGYPDKSLALWKLEDINV